MKQPLLTIAVAGGPDMSLSEWQVLFENDVGCVSRGPDGLVLVRPRGELDLATGHKLEDLFTAARSQAESTVRVDLSRVSFIDASSIGKMTASWVVARDRGQRFGVDGLAGQPARVFEVLALDGLLLRRQGPVDRQEGDMVDRVGGVGRRRPARGPRGAR